MRFKNSISTALTLCFFVLIPALANAAILRFTATSAASGILGFLDYNSAVFNGTAFQFVDNSNILNLNFVDPNTGAVDTTIGPTGSGTIFDSTGLLPTVVDGSGFTGGLVILSNTNFVRINHSFSDVTWSTAPVSVVPLPAALPLFGTGLAALGFAGWRKRRKTRTVA